MSYTGTKSQLERYINESNRSGILIPCVHISCLTNALELITSLNDELITLERRLSDSSNRIFELESELANSKRYERVIRDLASILN